MDLQSVDLTANVGHAIYFNGTLGVAPEALGYVWRLDWWLGESHGHSYSPESLNSLTSFKVRVTRPLIQSAARNCRAVSVPLLLIAGMDTGSDVAIISFHFSSLFILRVLLSQLGNRVSRAGNP